MKNFKKQIVNVLVFSAIVILLSSCSDYKKINYAETKVDFEISQNTFVSSKGVEISFVLKGFTINKKRINAKDQSVTIKANSKQEIETENIGIVKIKIKQKKKDPRSIPEIDFWMTDEQLKQFD